MHRFLALVRKEVRGVFCTPSIYFATAFFILLDSFAFYLTTVSPVTAYAVFDEMAMFMLFTSIILYPLIAMSSFSEENASGTLETLLTAPISHLQAVLSKYIGLMVFVVFYLLHGLVYAALLSYGGNLDWHSALSALFALVAVGSLAMSLGVFISALTAAPVAAAAGAGGILIFMALTADVDPYSGTIADILNSLSFIPHAKRWIAGELDSRGLVYFITATALFLFYAWMSVGIREVGKGHANRTVRRRMTVTYFLILSGIVLLITQVAVLHIRGFWESGMPVGPNLTRVPKWNLVPLLLSVICFGWSCLTFRAAKRAERDRGGTRSLRYATITESRVMGAPRYFHEENRRQRRRMLIAALSALLVVINLNWLSHYPFRTFAEHPTLRFLAHFQERRWDVSEDGRNTLSDTTRRALDSLQGRVQVYSFLSERSDVHGVPVAEEIRRLLGRYTDYNALITPTYADAVREPEMASEIAQELGLGDDNLENVLVLDYQGRRLSIPAAGLVAPPDWRAQITGETRWVFDGENRLTQALMRLSDPRVPNVYFVTGHLELSLVAGPYPDRSASRLNRAMAGANMRVRQHIITPTRPIPPECDILVVAAPRVPYQAHEVAEIRRYLDHGGRLLLIAPTAGEEYLAANDLLNELAFELGGGYRDDVMEDEKNNDHGQALAPLGRARNAGEGAIDFVFPVTRTIRDNPRSAESGWACERLVESFPSSFSASIPDGERRPGPFTMVYRSAKTTDSREARVVTVASGRMAADSDIIRGANEPLLMGLIQWLAGREETRDIEARTYIDRRLTLTGPQFRAILWLGLVALPLWWLMTGVTIWWTRRE